MGPGVCFLESRFVHGVRGFEKLEDGDGDEDGDEDMALLVFSSQCMHAHFVFLTGIPIPSLKTSPQNPHH